jgi:hypothetical protein
MHRRARLALTTAIGLLAAGVVVLPGTSAHAGPSAAAVAADPPPPLAVRRTTSLVELEKYGTSVYLDLGAFLVAGAGAFEVRTVRPSYREPLNSTIYLGGVAYEVPEELVGSFTGPKRLVTVTLHDPEGAVVHQHGVSMCTWAESVRVRPDAPDISRYPRDCYGYNPLSLGSVSGIEAGWAMSLVANRSEARLPLGRYMATVSIGGAYQDLLGLPAETSTARIRVRVVEGDENCPDCGVGRADGGEAPTVDLLPDRTAPRLAAPPPGTPLPDLRSLPAFGMQMRRGRWLAFGANVWNAGPSPLVVDGFRRPDEDVMDAFQYFYDIEGDPAGRTRVGTMEWDPRDGHHHWHFKDFARYRLLDADQNAVVRSKKEAFCLANTDAIDYTVPGANWNPGSTDLHTACGDAGSIGVREVLDVGSGDTYGQFRPGQSFDVADLPAGKYFIEVTGNPMRNLAEADITNNTSLRPVWITGKPGGARGVRVRPVGLVDIG